MAKEKNYNPVNEHRKSEKAKELKKGKAGLQAQRNEKLARKNPERIKKSIDDLKDAEKSGGLRPRDRENLNQLEKDLRAVQKAREALGDKAPKFGRIRDWDDQDKGRDGGRGGGVLGKRGRDGHRKEDDSSDTDEDARQIPMPRDTPPPIPRSRHDRKPDAKAGTDSNGQPHTLPKKPATPEAKTVYSSAPQIRNLQKEATSRFIPTAVKRKIDQTKGTGGRLLEPEELDKLEKEGYRDAEKAAQAATEEAEHGMMAVDADVHGKAQTEEDRLKEEEERFERHLKELENEGNVAQGAMGDAERAAEAAVEEAEHEIMMSEGDNLGDSGRQAQKAEKHLRHVEIEDVTDEDDT